MRSLLLVAVVVVASGCISVKTQLWRPQERRGVVSAALGMYAAPPPQMVGAAWTQMRAICRSEPRVIEEERQMSGDVSAWAFPVAGGGAIAGTSQGTDYYWAFECTKDPPHPG